MACFLFFEIKKRLRISDEPAGLGKKSYSKYSTNGGLSMIYLWIKHLTYLYI